MSNICHPYYMDCKHIYYVCISGVYLLIHLKEYSETNDMQKRKRMIQNINV